MSTPNTTAGMLLPKTDVAAKGRDKTLEHFNNLPQGTKESNMYMPKREAARERKLAAKKREERIENARKLLAQFRAEMDDEEAEDEAREEVNRLMAEEEEGGKGKEKEEVTNRDHQTIEAAVTHSYVEEPTEANESEFSSYPDAEMPQDNYAKPSNWASASYVSSAAPVAALALSRGSESPSVVGAVASAGKGVCPGSAEPIRENEGEPSGGETAETDDTHVMTSYAEEGYPSSTQFTGDQAAESSDGEMDNSEVQVLESFENRDDSGRSLVRIASPNEGEDDREPAGGVADENTVGELTLVTSLELALFRPEVAHRNEGEDDRQPAGGVADESTVGELTLLTSLELALFGPNGVHREETDMELSNSGPEAMLPDTMTFTDDGNEGPSGGEMGKTDVEEVTSTALDMSLFGPDVTTGGVGQDETEKEFNGEGSKAMLLASLTSTDDQVENPSDSTGGADEFGTPIDAASPRRDDDEREPSGGVVGPTYDNELTFTAMDLSLFGPDDTSGSVEQEVTGIESSGLEAKAGVPEKPLTGSHLDDAEDEALLQVAVEMGAEEFISPVVKSTETTADGVSASHVLRPRSVTPLSTVGRGTKRKAAPQEDNDQAEGAAPPPRKKTGGGRPRKTAAKPEAPAEPRNLRSRSKTPFVPESLPVAAPTKRTAKRKATPVVKETVREPKKAKGRPRKVVPAAEKEATTAPGPRKAKGPPRKAAAPASRPLSAGGEGRLLRNRSATPLATTAAVSPPPPALHQGRVLRSRSVTPFVPPPPPPPPLPKPKRKAKRKAAKVEEEEVVIPPSQPKAKRTGKKKAPTHEEGVGDGDEEAPPQEVATTKARKTAKPPTRRSSRAKRT